MQVPLAYVGLDEQSTSLTLGQAKHILRRTGFGATETQLQNAVGQPANTFVDAVISNAMNTALPADAPWANQTGHGNSYELIRDFRYDMVRQMYTRGFAEKMAFFWHDHFASEVFVHNEPAYSHKAIKLYREKAFGDFFDLLEEVGKGPDMLYYLSGIYSSAGSPNENYARELLELFTMGQFAIDGSQNYTETDIREIAKALTGWRVDPATVTSFVDTDAYDDGSKSIFGQVDTFDYAGVHALIKSQRSTQTAEFIVSKIYKYFVYEYVNEQVVSELASYFIQENWSIESLLRRLFKSRHFFQEDARGTIYKTPLDYFIGALRDSNMAIDDQPDVGTFRFGFWTTSDQGMVPLSANDVSGWDEYRGFISTGNFANRWSSIRTVLYGWSSDLPEQNLVSWASSVCNNSTNPPQIVSDIVSNLFVKDLPPEIMLVLENAFRASVPAQEFENGNWDWNYPDAPQQVILMLFEMYKLPEYNLI